MPFTFSTVLRGVNVESDSSEFIMFLQSRPVVEICAAVRLKTTVRWSGHQVARKQKNAEKARMEGWVQFRPTLTAAPACKRFLLF